MNCRSLSVHTIPFDETLNNRGVNTQSVCITNGEWLPKTSAMTSDSRVNMIHTPTH